MVEEEEKKRRKVNISSSIAKLVEFFYLILTGDDWNLGVL